MKGFLAVASLEIVERRRVFLAAAITAAGPFLAPLLKEPRSHPPADVRLMAAAFLAVAVAAALSLILGGTAIGRDLSERRLGFYFSRPIGGAAIWAGKLAGAWAVVLLASAIVLLPAMLFDLPAWRRMIGSGFGPAAAAFGGGILVLLALGNVASLAIRSRSAWVAADLAALALWAGLMAVIAFPLLAADAPVLLRGLALAVGAAGAAALLAAGGAQVTIGRADAARGNRARFATLWSLLFVLAGLWLVSARWLLSVSPKDLLSPTIGSVAAQGSWVEIDGLARGRADLRASLLYDLDSKRFVPVGAGRRSAVVISADGSTAAWVAPTTIWADGPQEIWMCRLSERVPERVRTPVSGRIWNLEISPDGTRVAIVGDAAVAVHEIPSGRLLGSVPFAAGRFSRVVFIEPGRLRLYRIPPPGASPLVDVPAAIEIFEFDPARGLSRPTTIANIRRPFALTFDERKGRMIVWERGNSLSLFDVATGGLVAVLGNVSWDVASRGFLSDGRIAIAEAAGGTARLHLYSPEGAPDRVYELGPADNARLGAETAPGTLAVGVSSGLPAWGPTDAHLLDLRDGRLRLLARHTDSVVSRMRWRLPQPEPGSTASLLFSRVDGALLRLDPATQRLTPVLPR